MITIAILIVMVIVIRIILIINSSIMTTIIKCLVFVSILVRTQDSIYIAFIYQLQSKSGINLRN